MLAKTLNFSLAVILVIAELPNEEPSSSAVILSNRQTGHPLVGVARVALIPYGEFLTVKCKPNLSVAVHGAWYVMMNIFGAVETDKCKHSDIPKKDKLCPLSQPNKPGFCRLDSRDPSTNPVCQKRGVQIVYSCYNHLLRDQADASKISVEWHKGL
ncbi:uncharacterized protein LOC129583431 [Paramacrobiotus metropolitanus]|uniref:uncharacterized protein LOC129583431 n=1 Tax=Paramacrobiotus metropolitanus TaxID=2943436 RepID=UPI0024465818|nr:uncharacterized protein LOC129583431 [Paramacrobiotus metropolitanus]